MWSRSSGRIAPDPHADEDGGSEGGFRDDAKASLKDGAGHSRWQDGSRCHEGENAPPSRGSAYKSVPSDFGLRSSHPSGVWTWLEAAAASEPAKVASVSVTIGRGGTFAHRTTDYRALHRRSSALACLLWKFGLRKNAKVGVLSPNSQCVMEMHYAVAAIQGTVVNLNSNLKAAELKGIIEDSEMECLICHPGMADIVEATLCGGPAGHESRTGLRKEHSPSLLIWADDSDGDVQTLDHCFCKQFLYQACTTYGTPKDMKAIKSSWGEDFEYQMYYTSGTTGKSKGVVLHHSQICLHALGTIEEMGLCAHDVWAHVSPMFHLVDAFAIYAITYVRGTHVVVPSFQPAAVLHILGKVIRAATTRALRRCSLSSSLTDRAAPVPLKQNKSV